ncbi:MAG TPA: NUDIX hydrolase [bacterium]|nr:NUDIX hydrolase [bacterium]
MTGGAEPKVLRSRHVFQGRAFAVRVDEMENPSGRRWSLEVVEHPGAVAILALLPDRDVVLVRQTRPAVGRVLYEIPAGTLEPPEPPEACARRELAEEAGYAARTWERLATFYPAPGISTEELHLFLAQDLHPVSAQREEEDMTVHRVPLAVARRLVATGELHDAKSIVAVLLAAERFGVPAG